VRLAGKDAEGGVGLCCIPIYDFSVWLLVVVTLYHTGAHIITHCKTNHHIVMVRLYTPMSRLEAGHNALNRAVVS